MDVITTPTDEWLREKFPLGPITLDADLQSQLDGLIGTLNWFHETLSRPLSAGQRTKGTLEWMMNQRMEEARDTAEPEKSISFSVEDYARLAADLTADEWTLANLSLWSNRTHDAIVSEFKDRADQSGEPQFGMLVTMLQMAPSSLSLAMAIAVTTRAMHLVVCRSFMRAHPEVRFDFGHHVLWSVNIEAKSVDIVGYRSDTDKKKAEAAEAAVFGAAKPSNN